MCPTSLFSYTTTTNRVRRPLGLFRLMILYDRVSPRHLMNSIWCQQPPLSLPTTMPVHRASIGTTALRNLSPPTKTFWPPLPEFCDSFLPINLMKMMISNLRLFDVASISSLFVDFPEIALCPTYLFLLATPGKMLNAARDRNIKFLLYQAGHRSHHPHLHYAGVRGSLTSSWLFLSDRRIQRPFFPRTSPHSFRVFTPIVEIFLITSPPPLSLSDVSLSIFLRPWYFLPYFPPFAPQPRIYSATFQLVRRLCSNQEYIVTVLVGW